MSIDTESVFSDSSVINEPFEMIEICISVNNYIVKLNP